MTDSTPDRRLTGEPDHVRLTEAASENSDGIPVLGVTMNVASADDFDDDPGL